MDRSFFFEPTVFGSADNSSTIAQEEIFGPVLVVIPADDENHAVELANDSIYGQFVGLHQGLNAFLETKSIILNARPDGFLELTT